MFSRLVIALSLLASSCSAFSVNNHNNNNNNVKTEVNVDSSRRQLFQAAPAAAAALAILVQAPQAANAGIDPNALKNLQVEGDDSGAAQRLRALNGVPEDKARPEDTVDIPYEKLASGVEYRQYREGKGDAIVKDGSKVAVEMTIRCKSFATANEPGGLKYFSTKVDTDFDELAWTVGSGELPPGLEEGMAGMKRGAVRRIEVPSTMVFAARNDKQLPLPKDGNKNGKRIFDRLFKTDATLLFEVLVTRIK